MIDEKKVSKKSHHNSTSAKNQDSLITELKQINEGAKPERRNVTFYEADEDTVDSHKDNTKATSSQTTAAYGTTNFAFGTDDSSNSTKLCNKEKDRNKYRTDFKSSRAATSKATTSQAKSLRATTSEAISSRATTSEAIPSRATTSEAIPSRATKAEAISSRATTANPSRAATTEAKSTRATSAESKSLCATKSSLDVVSSEDEYIPVTVIQSEPQTSKATRIG